MTDDKTKQNYSWILLGIGITILFSFLLGYGIYNYIRERPLDVIVIFLFSYAVQTLYYNYVKKRI